MLVCDVCVAFLRVFDNGKPLSLMAVGHGSVFAFAWVAVSMVVVVVCMLALVMVMAVCIMASMEGVGVVWVLKFVVMLVVSSVCTPVGCLCSPLHMRVCIWPPIPPFLLQVWFHALPSNHSCTCIPPHFSYS